MVTQRKNDVFMACDQLLEEGAGDLTYVTFDRVGNRLEGNTGVAGSRSTISKYTKEWKKERGLVPENTIANKIELSSQIEESVRQLKRILSAEIDSEIDKIQEEAEHSVIEKKAIIEHCEKTISEKEKLIEGYSEKQDALKNENKELTDKLNREREKFLKLELDFAHLKDEMKSKYENYCSELSRAEERRTSLIERHTAEINNIKDLSRLKLSKLEDEYRSRIINKEEKIEILVGRINDFEISIEDLHKKLERSSNQELKLSDKLEKERLKVEVKSDNLEKAKLEIEKASIVNNNLLKENLSQKNSLLMKEELIKKLEKENIDLKLSMSKLEGKCMVLSEQNKLRDEKDSDSK